MNKKGMEMSINVIVGIILGMVMLGAGITIFTKVIDNSRNISITIDEKIKEEMLSSFDDGSLIYPRESDITIGLGKSGAFHFLVYNINPNPTTFQINITSIPPDLLKHPQIIFLHEEITLDAKEKEVFKFLVETESLDEGQYSILIEVDDDDNPNTEPYAKRIVRANVR